MNFEITILGSSSAAPAYNRNQTSQLIRIQNYKYLIDCGEGTQHQLKKYKIRTNKINGVFISHLHGDHYYGLIGLISTMHLFGRRAPFQIYGPPGLAEILTIQMKYSETVLNYQLDFHEWTPGEHQLLLENDQLTVECFPLDHRIHCAGFVFKEKVKNRRIIKEKLPPNLSPTRIMALKKGKDLIDENGDILVKNEEATLDPRTPRSYGYCSDTRYDERILPYIESVDLLYHEATFMNDMAERAKETYHSTTIEAATIAKKAAAKMLVIGHYSTRYRDLLPLLEEAKQYFRNTRLAVEGQELSVNGED